MRDDIGMHRRPTAGHQHRHHICRLNKPRILNAAPVRFSQQIAISGWNLGEGRRGGDGHRQTGEPILEDRSHD